MTKRQNMEYLILSGSLPRGVTPNHYGQLILAGKKKNAFIVIDTDGKSLRESIEYQPTCIKPNTYELSRLAERELQTESEIMGFCEKIHQKGIPYILVSRGRKGLLLSSVKQKIKAIAPPVEVDSTVGAGDSVVGGFVLAHSRVKTLRTARDWHVPRERQPPKRLAPSCVIALVWKLSCPGLNYHFFKLGCLFLKQGNDDVSIDCRQ